MILGSILSRTDLARNRFERLYLRLLGVPDIGSRVRLGLICKLVKGIITPQACVLDAGCGNGLLTLTLAQALSPEGRVWSIDVDQERVARAHAWAKMVGLEHKVQFEVQNLIALSFDDASFDLIICADVIEHIEEDERAMAELFRVQRPSGRITLSTVTPTNKQRSFLYRVTAEEHGHVREGYSKTSLLQLIQDAGYVVEQFRWSDRYLDRLAWEVDSLIGQRKVVKALLFPFLLLMARLDALLPREIVGNNMTVLAHKPGG